MDKQFLPEVTWSIRLTGTRADTTAAFAPIDLITTGGPNALQETPARLPVLITEVMAENTAGWRDRPASWPPGSSCGTRPPTP